MEKLTAWQSTRDVNFVGSYDLIVGVDDNNQPIYKDRIVTIDFVMQKKKLWTHKQIRKLKRLSLILKIKTLSL